MLEAQPISLTKSAFYNVVGGAAGMMANQRYEFSLKSSKKLSAVKITKIALPQWGYLILKENPFPASLSSDELFLKLHISQIQFGGGGRMRGNEDNESPNQLNISFELSSKKLNKKWNVQGELKAFEENRQNDNAAIIYYSVGKKEYQISIKEFDVHQQTNAH